MSENGTPQQRLQPKDDTHPADHQVQNPEHPPQRRYSNERHSPDNHYEKRDGDKEERGRSRDSRDSMRRDEQNGNNQQNGDERRRSYTPQDQRQRSRSPAPATFQLYVGGLSHDVSNADLRDLFSAYGEVVNIVTKGRYGFVEFNNLKDADAALAGTDGMKFHGYTLSVQHPKPRDGKGPRRGGPSGEDKCWSCGDMGHWSSQCPKGGPRDRIRRRSYSRGSRSPPRRRRDSRDRGDDGRSRELRDGLCFFCKERGHRKMDCPQLRGGRGGPPRDYRRSRSREPVRRRDDSYDRYRSPPRRRYDSPPRRGYDSPPRRGYDSPPRRGYGSPPRRRDSRSPPRDYQRRYRDDHSPPRRNY